MENYRLLVFLFLLIGFALLEFILPQRVRTVGRSGRWLANLSLTILNSFVAKVSIGAAPFLMATYASNEALGLFNWLSPQLGGGPLRITLEYIALDLVVYFQHRYFHRSPMLWKLHKVHHTDVDLDVTSGFRFHTLEILISLIIKIIFVALLGVSALGVVFFEILLNAGSLFNHSNINISEKIEPFVNRLVVTPRMHLVHHSVVDDEHNSNFCFTISLWDRLFNTYRDFDDCEQITVGLGEYKAHNFKFTQLLLLPFKKKNLQD
jgi:sterol desaturase/sphingolipid hydroxylase (fatty acid hydroxylase superfamily)